MAGWSHEKRVNFERAFYAFLDNAYVNSKDAIEPICLGKALYRGQRQVITQILDALEEDIHKIYILKSRQLGITTIIRALSIFYIGVHKGLKGALVFDTAPNREEARAELVTMIRDLPDRLKFPRIKGAGEGNRDGVTLQNDSKILFKNAGVKKSRSSGTLGRSVGLAFAHMSELCSYDNDEGLAAFEESLSDSNPIRLYIYESTARGFNSWKDMWEQARKDEAHCCCIFLGWWSKDSQRIARGDPDFERYGKYPPTEAEKKKIHEVLTKYGVEITPEQLAWYRRKVDPTALSEGDLDPEFEASGIKLQEQPWTEEEAFQQTGSVFFPAEVLTEATVKTVSHKFQAYTFMCGQDFVDMKIYKSSNPRMIDLRVWEEPEADGFYIVGVDPAYGTSEHNDHSSIEVYRAYADGLDQVAEYSSPLTTTRQLAWVLSAILGWYGSPPNAAVKYALELNGPGYAVFNALKEVRTIIESGLQAREMQERGLLDIFRNVRTYIYGRPDSMGAGSSWHIKCLAIDTPLPTPRGWIRLEHVRVGDELFDERGEICRVTATSNVKLGHPCYEVMFDDKSTIIADADHVWEVQDRSGPVKKTTANLIPGVDAIATTKPLNIPDRNLPIDPYTLGVWLGDGSSADGRIHKSEADLREIMTHVGTAGYEVYPIRKARTASYCTIKGLRGQLNAAGLLENKRIPYEYLRGSFAQRLALLQGMMDTDGGINPNNGRQCTLTTTNPKLAEGIAELLRTLGMKARYHILHPKLQYKGRTVQCAPAIQFYFTAYPDLPVFRLKRKLVLAASDGTQLRMHRARQRRIVSCEPVPSVPVKCISVDSPSHLFLAGPAMIPTHNTTQALKVMYLERFRDHVTNYACRLRSRDLIEEMKYVARDGDSISAPSSKRDDRVFASAFADHCWADSGVKRQLMTTGRTRDAEAARQRVSITDQVVMFQRNQLNMFFERKRRVRVEAQKMAVKQAWRYR